MTRINVSSPNTITTTCICIIAIFASVFEHISSCSHLYSKRQRGWAQFGPWGHVARGLGAIRAVCRAWQALFIFLGLGHIQGESPGFRVSASPIPVYVRKI